MNEAVVIIPTYNERNNLPGLVKGIVSLDTKFDMLVVDDNSPDGTGEVADQLTESYPAVNVLHRSAKEGLGRAYLAGFDWAIAKGYEYVFTMDADHSHSPDQLPDLYEAAKSHDLVLGSRYVGGIRVLDWDMKRLLISAFGNWYARTVTGLPYFDLTSGYKCYRRKVLESVPLKEVRSIGYAFIIEMTWWAAKRGFDVCEVPIIFYGRNQGSSKFSKRIIWEAVWTVWRLRLGFLRNKP